MKPPTSALAACLYLFTLLPIISAAEQPLEHVNVVALAPFEERAVVTLPDGSMHVVGRGDMLPGTAATVLQVLPDKLVLEEPTGNKAESGKHLVWLHKRPQADGGSRVQRIYRKPPAATGLSMAQPALNALQP